MVDNNLDHASQGVSEPKVSTFARHRRQVLSQTQPGISASLRAALGTSFQAHARSRIAREFQRVETGPVVPPALTAILTYLYSCLTAGGRVEGSEARGRPGKNCQRVDPGVVAIYVVSESENRHVVSLFA